MLSRFHSSRLFCLLIEPSIGAKGAHCKQSLQCQRFGTQKANENREPKESPMIQFRRATLSVVSAVIDRGESSVVIVAGADAPLTGSSRRRC
jgi:hypothetical protein